MAILCILVTSWPFWIITFRTVANFSHPSILPTDDFPWDLIHFGASDEHTLSIHVNITVFRKNWFGASHSCKRKNKFSSISNTYICSLRVYSSWTRNMCIRVGVLINAFFGLVETIGKHLLRIHLTCTLMAKEILNLSGRRMRITLRTSCTTVTGSN